VSGEAETASRKSVIEVSMHHALAQLHSRRWFRSGLAIATVVVAVTALSAPTRAANVFDGYWNVSIKTQAGACDPSYSFAVEIADGRLNGANGALVGLVSNKGAVSVQMGGGDRRGTANGKLSGNGGAGRWSGKATGASCSGRWTAQRG
jgi:hypothetical protein